MFPQPVPHGLGGSQHRLCPSSSSGCSDLSHILCHSGSKKRKILMGLYMPHIARWHSCRACDAGLLAQRNANSKRSVGKHVSAFKEYYPSPFMLSLVSSSQYLICDDGGRPTRCA